MSHLQFYHFFLCNTNHTISNAILLLSTMSYVTYTALVNIMLTLTSRTVVSSISREMCVRALNGTVARWLMCVKHDGKLVETLL